MRQCPSTSHAGHPACSLLCPPSLGICFQGLGHHTIPTPSPPLPRSHVTMRRDSMA